MNGQPPRPIAHVTHPATSPDPQQVLKQLERILGPLEAKSDEAAVALAAQCAMALVSQLPPPVQQTVWVAVLTRLAHSSNAHQKKLLDEIRRLKQPPRKVALVEETRRDKTGQPLAIVSTNNALEEVAVSEDVEFDSLFPAQRVLLAQNNAVIEARDLVPVAPCCEFDRMLDDGRLLVRTSAENTAVLVPGGELRDSEALEQLHPGDLIEYLPATLRAVRLAHRAVKIREFAGQMPDVTRDDIGGLDDVWRQIEQDVLGPIVNPRLYADYGIKVPRGVLFSGPPGVGKTMLIKAMARATLAALGLDQGAPVLFSISGSSLLRPYVGEGEAMLRGIAKAAEEAANAHGFAIVLLDDFEYAGGLHRGMGDRSSPAYSALTASLISVMDGLADRNVRVTYAATTNRTDLIDAALLRDGRFGSNRIEVPRPGFDACKAIGRVHLRGVPLADNLSEESAAEHLAQRVFDPAEDNVLLRIQYADAEQEEILPPRLINGALVADTIRSAAVRAVCRDLEAGRTTPAGVCLEDIIACLDDKLQSAASVVTTHNSHQHFLDLPDDRRVVAVHHVNGTRNTETEAFVA